MHAAIAVVGHVERIILLSKLIERVDPFYLAMDDGRHGCFVNHRRAWTALARIEEHAEWGVVLEDDAEPVHCFREQLDEALEAAPSPIVSLYLGRDRPRDVQPAIRELVNQGIESCWITTQRMLHAVGIAIRSDLIPDMLDHTLRAPAVFLPIDRAIGHWAQTSGLKVSYSWPSLVDHADQEPVIDMHPDGQARGPWVYDEHGMPVLQRRVAWRVGIRDAWDSSAIGLEKQ